MKFYNTYKNLINIRSKKVNSLVNMTISELEKWKREPCSKVASVKRLKVINRVIKVISTPKTQWSSRIYRDAGKIISYISRASKIKITRNAPATKYCKETTNYYALKNWGFDQKKRKRKNRNA